jgi:hypothetical protein
VFYLTDVAFSLLWLTGVFYLVPVFLRIYDVLELNVFKYILVCKFTRIHTLKDV